MPTPPPGRPRITPLHRISRHAARPTIIVSSPLGQLTLMSRASTQLRPIGNRHATARSQSSVENVCHAFTCCPPDAPASFEYGSVRLVVNQGSHMAANSRALDTSPNSCVRELDERLKDLRGGVRAVSEFMAHTVPTGARAVDERQPQSEHYQCAWRTSPVTDGLDRVWRR